MAKARFQVDTRLAKLLSENYRSSERALKELVDNAWDADASVVKIQLPEPMTDQSIIVLDDGTGMTEEEVKREYLLIARDRRERRGSTTSQNNRKVKGRKGIGKFAGLMVANAMHLETWARGRRSEFTLTSSDYEAAKDIEALPILLRTEENRELEHGTRVSLSSLNQSLAFPNPDKLRQLLLEEYGREEHFLIEVNGKPLGVDDIDGAYTEHSSTLPIVGLVNLRFTITSQKRTLRQPGISMALPDFLE